jgi:hypothetical protein
MPLVRMLCDGRCAWRTIEVSNPTSSPDQAWLPAFRATLAAQAIAGLAFGLAPLALTAAYASAIGFSGDDPLVYRLGGAATIGYFVAPVLAIAWGASWREIRIPAIATLTFTIGAFVASALELAGGARQLVVPFVIVAGLVFTAIAAYWLRRDEAPAMDPGRPLDTVARVILGLATLSAATFGILPLIAPGPFATLFGLAGTDSWVFRLAGAGCLGYATAGIASLIAPGYRLVRIQNMAAITFNGFGAASAWLAIVSGNGGILAPIVAAAATFFTVALVRLDRRLA